MGSFIPTVRVLVLGIFEIGLYLSDFPLNTARRSLRPTLRFQTLAPSRAPRRFPGSPLGFFQSTFGSIFRTLFHNID
jgi:hypothetical protein